MDRWKEILEEVPKLPYLVHLGESSFYSSGICFGNGPGEFLTESESQSQLSSLKKKNQKTKNNKTNKNPNKKTNQKNWEKKKKRKGTKKTPQPKKKENPQTRLIILGSFLYALRSFLERNKNLLTVNIS